MRATTIRLKPGQDLFAELDRLVRSNDVEAGCVLCAVGSLTHARLRLANRDTLSDFDGHFEIVSLTGTLSLHGSHLHVSISDEDGQTLGGHLVPGCVVYTTVELVVAIFDDVIYRRELLPDDSGYEELVVVPR